MRKLILILGSVFFVLVGCLAAKSYSSRFYIIQKVQSEAAIEVINKILTYYENTYGKCQHDVVLQFLDLKVMDCGGTPAIGCTAIWKGYKPTTRVFVTLKDRHICQVILTAIHELRHACHDIPDCYEDKNCWSYELDRNIERVCIDVLETE